MTRRYASVIYRTASRICWLNCLFSCHGLDFLLPDLLINVGDIACHFIIHSLDNIVII